jgi:hypothetical protein
VEASGKGSKSGNEFFERPLFCGWQAMAETFDPYYEWLGIPPAEQPPHHYRLLGVTLFEGDLKLIRNAADQRIIYLRTFQLSKYSEESQRLLNQVSAASVCLSDPQKKIAYDEQLHQELKAKAPVGEPQPPASPAVPAVPTAPAKRSWPLVAAIGAGVVAICVVLAMFLPRGGDERATKVAEAPVAAPLKPQEPAAPRPIVEKAASAPKSNAGLPATPAPAPQVAASAPAVNAPRNAPPSTTPAAPAAKSSMAADRPATVATAVPKAVPPVIAGSEKRPESTPSTAGPDTASHTIATAEPPAKRETTAPAAASVPAPAGAEAAAHDMASAEASAKPKKQVPAKAAVAGFPARIRGRFVMDVKGELQLSLNGKEIPFNGHLSAEVSLVPGEVLVVRIYSRFTYRALRMAFGSTDGHWMIPFRREHFRAVEGLPQAITAADVKRSSTMPGAGRPDSKHKEWADANLPAESEWMWGKSSKQWYQYACVVDREILKAGPRGAARGAVTAPAP